MGPRRTRPSNGPLGATKAAAALLASTLSCRGDLAIFDAHGPAAAAIAEGWWLTLALTITPALLVIGLLITALARRRPGGAVSDGKQGRYSNALVLLGGAVVPGVVLMVLMVVTFKLGAQVTRTPERSALVVDVVAHQYWWEVRYPEHGILTANEIPIPVREPVRFRITSADVIHSFWVPKLHGKLDMLPGHIDEIWLEASDAGIYRGQCAEFCGLQHALMAFEVVALPRAEFAAWVAARQRQLPRALPDDSLARRGREVFFEAECAHCHAIAGVTAAGPTQAVGPDLTHLASRRTLGALLMPNNRGNLAGWILEPQALKPGNRMPATSLSPADLHALLRYLESLH